MKDKLISPSKYKKTAVPPKERVTLSTLFFVWNMMTDKANLASLTQPLDLDK